MTEHHLIATRSYPGQPDSHLEPAERTLSLALGGALVFTGLHSSGLGRWLQIGLGAYGLFRGASGTCPLKAAVTPTPFEEEFQLLHGWKSSEAITRSVTINKPRAEVLAFFKAPQNIGPLIPWVDSVEALSADTSVWKASAPLNRTLQWTLSLSHEDQNALRWTTGADTAWQHEVTASFKEAPGGRGTEVKVVVVGRPPLGKIGYAVASATAQFTDKALLNLMHSVKQQLETGEVSTSHMRPDNAPDFFYVHPQQGDSVPADNHLASVKTGVVLEGGKI
jgi:uncharacterized membrane protein